MGLIEKIEATQFLGQEFATWLCWRSETGNGKFKLSGLDEFDLYCEAPVQLVCDYGEVTSVTLKGGTPMQSPEARLAMREGKKVDRMRVRVNWRRYSRLKAASVRTKAAWSIFSGSSTPDVEFT